MKHLFFSIVFFLLLNFFNNILLSQPYDPNFGIGGNGCTLPTNISNEKNSVSPGGTYKPERTNVYQGTNDESVFRILIVFVQYHNDYTYANNYDWPAQQEPSYMHSLLRMDRNNNYGNEWWNAYDENTETISDYFM